MDRYLETPLEEHLKTLRQMVFLVGPRQVGKTTLAKKLIPHFKEGINYYNWDRVEQRRILISQIFPGKTQLPVKEEPVIVFDEIHKYPRWKNTLKGLFDHYEPNTHWVITGSAALNVYRRGQDSLLGRHFTYHMAPLSVAEVNSPPKNQKDLSLEKILKTSFKIPDSHTQQTFEALLKFGGFPEPFFKGTESFLSRWRSTRLDRLINQDLTATENLRQLGLVENLMFLLPERVGSPLSFNSLRENLEVHFATVKHWIELLERVFYGFKLPPYSEKLGRLLKKEVKWYLWDWTEIENNGTRFENLVAIHLLKYVNYMRDLGYAELSLHYLRDKEKREVDFLICKNRKPVMAIECKNADSSPSPSLFYYAGKMKLTRCLQLVTTPLEPRVYERQGNKVEALSAASFLKELV